VVYGVAGALVYGRAARENITRNADPVLLAVGDRVVVREAADLPSLCVRLRVKTADQEYVRELLNGPSIHLFSLAETEQLLRNGERVATLSPRQMDGLIGCITELDRASDVHHLVEWFKER
jgi:hypothetical protein